MHEHELFNKAYAFLKMYESAFGAPEKECLEFWELKNALHEYKAMHTKKPQKPRNPKALRILQERFAFAQVILSTWYVNYIMQETHCIVARCTAKQSDEQLSILISFSRDGKANVVSIKKGLKALPHKEIRARLNHYRTK